MILWSNEILHFSTGEANLCTSPAKTCLLQSDIPKQSRKVLCQAQGIKGTLVCAGLHRSDVYEDNRIFPIIFLSSRVPISVLMSWLLRFSVRRLASIQSTCARVSAFSWIEGDRRLWDRKCRDDESCPLDWAYELWMWKTINCVKKNEGHLRTVTHSSD